LSYMLILHVSASTRLQPGKQQRYTDKTNTVIKDVRL
jgi:hypothetical protein